MIKLLVIADDFTGALDTGVQFRAKGTRIRVADSGGNSMLGTLDQELQVLIVDAETRHMPPAQAFKTVAQLVAEAREAGIPCIYKKTDSGLRGNIGSELAGILSVAKERRLHFIPAFPKMDRHTIGGIHYIKGVPVAQSVFGQDPFEPVIHSDVREMIAAQSQVETHLMGSCVPHALPEGVLIYDGDSDRQLSQIAWQLKQAGQLQLLAGCAGFAAVLPELLGLELRGDELPDFSPRLLTVCGSINPITVSQLDAGEKAGMTRVALTPQQKLDPAWLQSPEGVSSVAQWLAMAQRNNSCIIECGSAHSPDTNAYVNLRGISLERMRGQIAQSMGAVLKALLDRGLDTTLLVTGGDTLLAFLRQIDQEELIPIGELMPGIVLSRIGYLNKTYNLISKSGGFGPVTTLLDLEAMVKKYSKEERVC